MLNEKLYGSKLTRKHGLNAQPIAEKRRVATAPEKDSMIKNYEKKTGRMHPGKLVNKTDSSSEMIIQK